SGFDGGARRGLNPRTPYTVEEIRDLARENPDELNRLVDEGLIRGDPVMKAPKMTGGVAERARLGGAPRHCRREGGRAPAPPGAARRAARRQRLGPRPCPRGRHGGPRGRRRGGRRAEGEGRR